MRSHIFLVLVTLLLAASGSPPKKRNSKAGMDGSIWLGVDSYADFDDESRENKHSDSEKSDVCGTKACRTEAQCLSAAMDPTVDPCEDFYDFTCGGWSDFWQSLVMNTGVDVSRNEVIQAYLKLQIRKLLQEEIQPKDLGPIKEAKISYQACMETDDHDVPSLLRKNVFKIFEKHGGWPMATDPAEQRYQSWQSIANDYLRTYDVDTIYSLNVDEDWGDGVEQTLYVDQPSTQLSKEVMGNEKKSFRPMEFRQEILETVALRFARMKGYRPSPDTLKADAKAVVKFEVELLEITSDADQRNDLQRMDNVMTIGDLIDNYGPSHSRESGKQINWLKTIRYYFLDVNVFINKTDTIILKETDYFKALVPLLKKTPTRTIVNYIHWKMFSDLSVRFTEWTEERNKFPKRWLYCVQAHRMKDAIAYQLARRSYVSETTRKATEKIFKALQKEMWHLVSNANWMDQPTKEATIDKIFSMRGFMSFPDWYSNDTAVIQFYKGLIMSDDLVSNELQYSQWNGKRTRRMFKATLNKDAWPADEIELNAYYNPNVNSVDLTPWEIRANSHFGPGIPTYLNYATVGFTLGHEISHAFDIEGYQYDKDGNRVTWWSENAIDTFNERARCFVEQYNNMTVPELSSPSEPVYINGNNTLGENMADLVGLEIAYRAYHRNATNTRLPGIEGLTSDQLFFISFANTFCALVDKDALRDQVETDEHTPHHVRVNGVMMNSKQFAKAFNCPVGSKMNPLKKCNIWE